jgi:hypothetical protein
MNGSCRSSASTAEQLGKGVFTGRRVGNLRIEFRDRSQPYRLAAVSAVERLAQNKLPARCIVPEIEPVRDVARFPGYASLDDSPRRPRVHTADQEIRIRVGRSGCTNGRKSSRSMAHRQQPHHEVRVSQCLLRSAWTASVGYRCLAQSDRTAGCGPARPVVWQGRRGDSPPYADSAEIATHGRFLTGPMPRKMEPLAIASTTRWACTGFSMRLRNGWDALSKLSRNFR